MLDWTKWLVLPLVFSGISYGKLMHFICLQVKETGIPMPGRIIHNLDGKTSFIPYGEKGQVRKNLGSPL
jgi:hypothetical protein